MCGVSSATTAPTGPAISIGWKESPGNQGASTETDSGTRLVVNGFSLNTPAMSIRETTSYLSEPLE